MESWIGGIAQYLVERRYLLGLYIWVEHADQIMMMLVFTALTGTILQLFLPIVSSAWDRPGGLYYIQKALRVNLLCYLVPFVFLAFRLRTMEFHFGQDMWITYHYSNQGFFGTPQIRMVSNVINFIWLIGFIICFVRSRKKKSIVKRIFRMGKPAGPELQERMDMWKERMGLKEPISLWVLPGIPTSFTTGVRRKQIWLPVEMSMDKNDMMLIHELLHISHKDIMWGNLMNLVFCVNWYNPLCRRLIREMGKWDEALVDAEVLRYCSDKGAYMNLLLSQTVEWRDSSLAPSEIRALVHKQSEIKERILRMICHEERTRISKTKVIVMAAAIALVSFTAAIATSSLLVEAKGLWVEATDAGVKEEVNGKDHDFLVEEIMTAEEVASYKITVDESIDLAAESSGMINWELPGYEANETGSVYLPAGSTIEVMAFFNPDDKIIKIAVKRGGNIYSFVEDSGTLHHEFYISTSGYYRIAAFNPNSTTVTVTGHYSIQ